MTIDEMIRRLRTVRDDEKAMPLLTHEYAAIIAALRAGQAMRDYLEPEDDVVEGALAAAWDEATGDEG